MLKAIWDASAKRHYQAPALNFEKQTGIKGVGRVYKMPGGLSMAEMESYFPWVTTFMNKPVESWAGKLKFGWKLSQMGISMPERSSTLMYSRLAKTFCDLTPELKDVRYDPGNKADVKFFCFGVTSGYNPGDIDYFLNEDRSTHEGMKASLDRRIYGYVGQLYHRLSKLPGQPDIQGFIPSPETADHINAELDKLYGPDPVAAMMFQDRADYLEAENRKKFESPRSPTFWQRITSKL